MRLGRLLHELADLLNTEANANPRFAEQLEEILARTLSTSSRRPVSANTFAETGPRRGRRRAPAVLDPIALAGDSEEKLRSQLATLDLEQLKDIVAEYGMDPAKLVMKWKTPERIIDKIVEVSLVRARKGDAFRSTHPNGQ